MPNPLLKYTNNFYQTELTYNRRKTIFNYFDNLKTDEIDVVKYISVETDYLSNVRNSSLE